MINFKDLTTGEPQKYFTNYVKSRHNQQHSKLKWSKGTWGGTCSVDQNNGGWEKKFFPGWNENWFNAFSPGINGPISPDSDQCDVWEESPTLIVERDTFANFFHNSEDFFNTFVALSVLKWPIKDLQIFITDIYPKGAFWPIWSKAYFGGREPLTAWDLERKYGTKRVCFRKAAVTILGAAAPIAVASWDTECFGTSLVRAYADLVVRSLGLHYVNKGRDQKTVVVTYNTRRTQSQWPERQFCDTDHSYFDCGQLGHLKSRGLGRQVRNDNAVEQALKSLEGMTFSNGAKVKTRAVDFSTLDFKGQIEIDATTDLMIGPHGAGLMHNVFMPDRAALIELWIDGSSANRHFHNLAFWSGHAYQGVQMGNPVDTNKLLNLAKSAIEKIDLQTLPWETS